MAKLKINLPEEKQKIALKLKKSSIEILKNYSQYMSELHKKSISEDVIIDSMLEKFSKDKEFLKFFSSSSTRKGATVSEKENNKKLKDKHQELTE
ncbi:hypothetical protein [Silvanigrella aquatica]|uniref:Uncharacterized protein n=1 Tax=Silvanigrella aquatica TaxID=1915309 RepID=A0A1L4D4U8_9BACT|nr:hypothetical protein [Silvanigrella aquatica]APJ05236.1 hypothetical protein AXG55_14535 [Silvanigrella aquatica]